MRPPFVRLTEVRRGTGVTVEASHYRVLHETTALPPTWAAVNYHTVPSPHRAVRGWVLHRCSLALHRRRCTGAVHGSTPHSPSFVEEAVALTLQCARSCHQRVCQPAVNPARNHSAARTEHDQPGQAAPPDKCAGRTHTHWFLGQQSAGVRPGSKGLVPFHKWDALSQLFSFISCPGPRTCWVSANRWPWFPRKREGCC